MDEIEGEVLRRDQQQAPLAADTQRRVTRLRDVLTTFLSFAFMRDIQAAQSLDVNIEPWRHFVNEMGIHNHGCCMAIVLPPCLRIERNAFATSDAVSRANNLAAGWLTEADHWPPTRFYHAARMEPLNLARMKSFTACER
jgi:hypothetical protein